MLERSDIGENALFSLHDEGYDEPYNTQSLNADTMIFTAGRTAISLEGAWNFCVDLLDTGLRQKWYALPPKPRVEPWDYNPYEGETAPVPSCWQMLKEKWYFFEGSAWYTRAITPDLKKGRRLFLRVGAAQYDCKVFLNGQFLGNHYGGSTPFCVELTEALIAGENWLMLCVNNRRTRDRVPMQNTDWFNYGGIYREVALYETSATVIRDFFVALEAGEIVVRVHVDGPAGAARFRLPELGIDTPVVLSDGQGEARIAADPELWSPEAPKLYDVVLEAGGDRVTDRVGFRSIERRGTEIYLNGAPLFLRGISVHEDDVTLGKVTDEADIRRRFAHARELGCNFLRLAHYPHHELAASELPTRWAFCCGRKSRSIGRSILKTPQPMRMPETSCVN